MAQKKNFYAVKEGRVPGIYRTWAECQEQVNGFSGAVFKGFATEEEAHDFMGTGYVHKSDYHEPDVNEYKCSCNCGGKHCGDNCKCKSKIELPLNGTPVSMDRLSDVAIIYVDGSYMSSVSTTKVGAGAVVLYKGEEHQMSKCFNDKELAEMHQIGGEINGALMGIEKAKSLGAKTMIVRHDYQGVAKWALGEWKRNKVKTKEYHEKMQVLMSELNISFEHVKAHTGETYNELADQLAKSAILNQCD